MACPAEAGLQQHRFVGDTVCSFKDFCVCSPILPPYLVVLQPLRNPILVDQFIVPWLGASPTFKLIVSILNETLIHKILPRFFH